MAIQSSSVFGKDGFERSILTAIKSEIDTVAEQEIERAVKEATDRVRMKAHEIVARIAVAVATQITFERMGQEFVVRVLMPDNEKKKP